MKQGAYQKRARLSISPWPSGAAIGAIDRAWRGAYILRMTDITPSQRFRDDLLAALLPIAAEKGWTQTAIADAATIAGLTEGQVALAAPRGVVDLIDAFADWADQQMLGDIEGLDLLSMKVRARVRAAIWARLTALVPHRAAEAKAMAAMARPLRGASAPGLVWRTADRIWTALGDASTDENYYSKRTILAGVLVAVTVRSLADTDPTMEATARFLDQRIDNVMQFEKLKARLRPVDAFVASAWAMAARFRYAEKP
jgi:ubiquinone biosynthesis protein COQ9